MKRITFDKQQNKERFKRFETAIKFSVDAESNGVKGYAAIWNVLSTDRGGYLALFSSDSAIFPTYPITLQYNHNDDWLLATEANGTLTVGTDETGISIVATLD